MRVFAISDLHVDYQSNADWVADLSQSDFKRDILILAGDISDSPTRLVHAFDLLADRFLKVLFTPGNHDLWSVRCREQHSLAKYHEVRAVAADSGISMEPHHSGSLSIVPLNGWYDYSFGAASEELREVWADFYACSWPEGWTDVDVTRHFCRQNSSVLQTANETIISFSHFVPRIDLIPPFVPASVKQLAPVMGTRVLEEQIRWLGSSVHVYGHSHLNRHVEIDGITYVNNALGYPSEGRITTKELRCIFEQ